MARVVIVLGTPHNPFHPKLARQPRAEWSEDNINMVERGELLRDKLRRAQPDSLVMVGNDHFHQFFMDNMPAFVLGKMEVFDGTWYNEVREFDIPTCRVPGDLELARQILVGAMRKGVDFAFSDELKLDHSVVVPLMFVRPEMDLPIVPILSNCVAPPIPPAERFHQVGRILRQVIDEIPGDKRIGVVVSGNLSLEVGGPLQFAPHPMDEAFDDQAVDWLRRGDIEGAIRGCTYERLTATGNVSHAYLNYLLAAGVAGDVLPTHAEGMKRKGSTQGWFAWESLAEAVA